MIEINHVRIFTPDEIEWQYAEEGRVDRFFRRLFRNPRKRRPIFPPGKEGNTLNLVTEDEGGRSLIVAERGDGDQCN